eukprot:scaffold1730_cov117-Isochrysis_galbana.AAC.6
MPMPEGLPSSYMASVYMRTAGPTGAPKTVIRRGGMPRWHASAKKPREARAPARRGVPSVRKRKHKQAVVVLAPELR